MIRFICREANAGAACNIGGPVDVTYKTFHLDCPALEEWLSKQQQYTTRELIGCELTPDVGRTDMLRMETQESLAS